ncbi:MAG: NUDIX domain-containing protein [Planctomycetes bacterium]|nr:NUDIX domain-containing protein [Planctomycetota bacterium]
MPGHDSERQKHQHTELVACGLILRRSARGGPLWLLLKAAKHREWGFPKGHQDDGESVIETALRECAEECGIGLVAIDGPALELHYAVPNGRQKRTVYFPAITACSDVTLSREHVSAKWFDADGVMKHLPHPNIRALFRASLHAIR